MTNIIDSEVAKSTTFLMLINSLFGLYSPRVRFTLSLGDATLIDQFWLQYMIADMMSPMLLTTLLLSFST